jgi:hypothetical protein
MKMKGGEALQVTTISSMQLLLVHNYTANWGMLIFKF